jgi:uncharacterized protein
MSQTSAAGENPPSELDVVHDDEGHRYLLRRDGEHVGLIDYRLSGGDAQSDGGETYDLHHTEIRPESRGRGLGGVLVRGALEDLSERGAKVVPTCWYVRDFIRANREFADLLAEGHDGR